MYTLELTVPDAGIALHPGDKVKLGRFDDVVWMVLHDWYSYGGNRPVCGWYLMNTQNPGIVKPLSKPDLDDIYMIES